MSAVEGREISVSIYLFAVLAIILIFVGSAGVRVEFWALAKAFVFSLSSCTALMMVLGPKLWAAHKQMEVDISQLTSAEGSITSRFVCCFRSRYFVLFRSLRDFVSAGSLDKYSKGVIIFVHIVVATYSPGDRRH